MWKEQRRTECILISLLTRIFLLQKYDYILKCRSPVTHRMAPWVVRVFIRILPRILCIERPKKDNPHEDDSIPQEVLTDVFHVSSDDDKFTEYGSKRFSGDYGVPGK